MCYCVHTFRTNVLKIKQHRSREQSSKDINSYRNCCVSVAGLQCCSAKHCILYGLHKINLNLYVGQIVNNRLFFCLPFQLPSRWQSLNNWPTNDFSSRTEEISRLALQELNKNKQPWQPLMLSGLCVHVWVLTASLEKLHGRRWWRERRRALQWENQWLMAFPQGHHFLQLTIKCGEPRGSGH